MFSIIYLQRTTFIVPKPPVSLSVYWWLWRSHARDNIAKLRSGLSEKVVRNLNDHMGVVLSAVFSPDGQQVLTASKDGTAKLWSAASGQSVHTLGNLMGLGTLRIEECSGSFVFEEQHSLFRNRLSVCLSTSSKLSSTLFFSSCPRPLISSLHSSPAPRVAVCQRCSLDRGAVPLPIDGCFGPLGLLN